MDRPGFFDLYFDLERMLDALPQLIIPGLRNTLIMAMGATVIGLGLGLFLALAAISKRWWVRLPGLVYIDMFRGLPAILTILLIGFGLPQIGFAIFGRNRLAYATMALGIVATAYMAEIFRAGIQSIDKGQMEAARSLGMSHVRAMQLVIVPQAVRRVIPPLTNEFIALTKDTSLAFIIGATATQRELFRVGQNLSQQDGNLSPVVMAGLLYLVITIPMTRLTNYLDKRLREGRKLEGQPVEDELPATALPGSA